MCNETDFEMQCPAAYFFFAFVPDTGTEDFVCESEVWGGGRAAYGPGGGGRGRAGAGAVGWDNC